MTKRLRVLIVEDSAADAELLLIGLQHAGYESVFEQVDTPEEMIRALTEQSWDIIISDYVMPRFHGLAALKLAQEIAVDLPFIFMSGQIWEEVAEEAMRAGAHDYVLKGDWTRLIASVQSLLREAEVRRQPKRNSA